VENQLIEFEEKIGLDEGELQLRERLGGMLRCYYRDVAQSAYS